MTCLCYINDVIIRICSQPTSTCESMRTTELDFLYHTHLAPPTTRDVRFRRKDGMVEWFLCHRRYTY